MRSASEFQSYQRPNIPKQEKNKTMKSYMKQWLINTPCAKELGANQGKKGHDGTRQPKGGIDFEELYKTKIRRINFSIQEI
jgi:hypothetical protein